jgi:hypothetical protein
MMCLGAGGASQEWLYSQFLKRKIPFTEGGLYAWEAKVLPTEQVFEQIPCAVQSNYHWHNVPCTHNVSANNIVGMIKQLCKPEDYGELYLCASLSITITISTCLRAYVCALAVVFKLDIDTPSVEMPIMHQLLADPEAIALIDEMFFEYHVFDKYMQHQWGPVVSGDSQSAFALFSELRAKGLRIHSWV